MIIKKKYKALFIVSTSLILIVSTFFLIYYIAYYRDSFKKYTQNNTATLKKIAETIDSVLNSVESISTYISMQPSVQNILYQDTRASSLDYKMLQDDIISFTSSNSLYNSIYIYFFSTDKVLTNNSLFERTQFYDREIIDQALKRENTFIWYSSREIKACYFNNGNPVDVISLIRNFPLASKVPSASIIINIEHRKLFESVRNWTTDKKIIIALNGTPIASNYSSDIGDSFNADSFVDRTDFFESDTEYIYAVPSILDSFIYYSCVPKKEFLDMMYPKQLIILFFYIISIIMALSISFILFRINNKNYLFLLHISAASGH